MLGGDGNKYYGNIRAAATSIKALAKKVYNAPGNSEYTCIR